MLFDYVIMDNECYHVFVNKIIFNMIYVEYDIGRVLLDWIAGLQSNLVDWIVIDNPKSKVDFGFGLSIQFFHFNPNPKHCKLFFIKLKFHEA